jgi:pullulanase
VATATGFELHSVQKSSVDTTVRNASFSVNTNSGTFTVPALTTAIFIKPQGIEQAAGLAAGITRDSPDVAPYGNNTLYIRGSMNNNGDDGFTNADMFNYEGNGIYQLDTTLVMGEQTFTITSVNSQAVNIGFDDITVTSSSIAVVNSNGSLRFNAGTTGNYTFVIDASGTSPILTISAVTPQIDCSALADSSDAIPFNIAGDGQLYVKGDHSNWNAEEAFRLHYKGDNNYQAVASFDGDMQFKIASSDGSWTTQLWAQADGGSEINGSPLAIGVSYDVAYNNAGTDNNQSNLPAGMYSFLLTLNEANPSQGANVGQLIIQQCLP